MAEPDECLDPGSDRMSPHEAAITVAQATTPEAMLQCIVELARRVIPARYSALAVMDQSRQVTHFVTSGITPEQRATMGPDPVEHGLLQALTADRVPLLIPDIAADPRACGLPPNHPPMRTLLGVPILLGNRVLGNLYLSEREDGAPFGQDDLRDVQVLAVHAAAVIDRAYLCHQFEKQRDQLQIILDSLPAGVLIMAAPDARIEFANRTLLEMLFGSIVPPEPHPVYNRDLRLLSEDGTPLTNEQRPYIRALCGEVIRNQQLIVETARGQRMPVLAQAIPLPSVSGLIERAVLVFQDVTGPRAAEQLKDDFLSLISHEFRTPLTTIRGGAQVLARQGDLLGDQARQELLSDIVTESDHLDQKLTNLLRVTDIMAGRMEANTESVLMRQLVQKAAARASAHAPTHTFTVDIPCDLAAAEGDPELMQQVLCNLYENAVKYSPHGGEIRTTATSNATTVTIQVTDHGKGIAPDQIERVFERFHRTGVDPSVHGMGMGLYLSRMLVDIQKGTLAASSPGPGHGATFAVTLPVARGWFDDSSMIEARGECKCASS